MVKIEYRDLDWIPHHLAPMDYVDWYNHTAHKDQDGHPIFKANEQTLLNLSESTEKWRRDYERREKAEGIKLTNPIYIRLENIERVIVNKQLNKEADLYEFIFISKYDHPIMERVAGESGMKAAFVVKGTLGNGTLKTLD